MSISRHALKAPQRIAARMAESGATLSYGELEAQSCQLAWALRRSGLASGDRVVILMENNLHWFVIMWACRRAELLFVPVNWHLKAHEVRYVVENSDARAVITSERLLPLADAIVADLPQVRVKLTTGPSGCGFESLAVALADQPTRPGDDEREGGLNRPGFTGEFLVR